MKILHVITGLPKAAGTSVFVGELAARQAADGHDVSVLVRCHGDNCYPIPMSVRIVTGGQSIDRPDIVHVHALWDPWLTRTALAYRKMGAKLVWSPHGMLTPWALKSKWPKKMLGLLLYQYWSLRKADILHATAESEVGDIRRIGLRNPIVIAPLGVNIDALVTSSKEKYICFVSRIHRKKGLPNLIRAWSQIPMSVKRGWKIKIAGPDQDNHLSELYGLCDSLGISYVPTAAYSPSNAEIEFIGPVFGKAKDQLYAKASFSVLPTYSENFGSVVIESLAQATPVICTKGAPWQDLEEYDCGLWIDIGVEPLIKALTRFMRLPQSQLHAKGESGRHLVEVKYTWQAVSKIIGESYKEVLHRAY